MLTGRFLREKRGQMCQALKRRLVILHGILMVGDRVAALYTAHQTLDGSNNVGILAIELRSSRGEQSSIL